MEEYIIHRYHKDIDYRIQVGRYIKYLFNQWINDAHNSTKFPQLVSHSLTFDIVFREVENRHGRIIRSLCVIGDVIANIEITEISNHAYFNLFVKIMEYGFLCKTHSSSLKAFDKTSVMIHAKQMSITNAIMLMDVAGID